MTQLILEETEKNCLSFTLNHSIIQHAMMEDGRETFSIEHGLEKKTKHYHWLSLLYHFKPDEEEEVKDLRIQKRGIDYIFFKKSPMKRVRNKLIEWYGEEMIRTVLGDETIRIECKTDTHYTTGNLFLEETVINRQKEKKGWIFYSQADILSYLLGDMLNTKNGKLFYPRVIHFIDLHKLKEWYFFNKKKYPLIETYDKSLYQRVKGRIVPIWDIRNCVVESYNITIQNI